VVSGRSIEEIAQGRGGERVWQASHNGGAKKNAPASAEKSMEHKRRNGAAFRD
jgi:hypothetical protein